MQNNKILNTLSMAQKAGKVVSGEFSCENAVKSEKVYLLVIAVDASDNTKKKMTNMASFYHVPICFFETKEHIGRCIGKEYRSMVAVLDRGFAESIQKKLTC